MNFCISKSEEEYRLQHFISKTERYYFKKNILFIEKQGKKYQVDFTTLKNIKINIKDVIKFFALGMGVYLFQVEYKIIYVRLSSIESECFQTTVMNLKKYIDFDNYYIDDIKFSLNEKISIFETDIGKNVLENNNIRINGIDDVFIGCDLTKLILFDKIKNKKIMLVYMIQPTSNFFDFEPLD